MKKSDKKRLGGGVFDYNGFCMNKRRMIVLCEVSNNRYAVK